MLSAPFQNPDSTVISTDKTFYVALGQRIAERRKALGLTQQQLAESIGIAQQTLAHYEVGRLRVAAALLPMLSKTLGLSLDELFGDPPKSNKRGPAPKLQEQIERIGTLPRSKQRMLLDMLDAAINSTNAQVAESTGANPMTTVQITLPDQLAEDARRAGLLSDRAIRQLLEEAMRREAGRKLLAVADQLRAADIPSMRDEEVVAEVKAVRAERRPRSKQP